MNYKKRLENITVSTIAHHHKISRSVVKKMRKIELKDAVKKFLSKEDFNELIEKKLYSIPKKVPELVDFLKEVSYSLRRHKQLFPYFNKTEKGTNWYYSRFPCDICRLEIYRQENPLPSANFYNKIINV